MPARRPLLFMLLFLAVTWLQMALTAGAGGAVHHVALLWPFPFFFIAIALAEVSRHFARFGKLMLALAVMVICGQNLLVYNQHLEQLIRDGGHGSWTDAIFPLSNRLRQYNRSRIYIIDWGMFNSLRLLNQGGLDLLRNVEPFEPAGAGSSGDEDDSFRGLRSRSRFRKPHGRTRGIQGRGRASFTMGSFRGIRASAFGKRMRRKWPAGFRDFSV